VQAVESGDDRASREVDMSGIQSPHLRFWWKARSIDNTTENAYVEVYDGSWHTVLQVTQGQDDEIYHYEDIDLSSYTMSSDFKVQIRSEMGNSQDYFFVDDIEVVGFR
jgi:hypothetical protein